jgi:hypothetical protein
VKVGDLVRCPDDGLTFASGIDAGIGLVIQVEQYTPEDGLSIHVQWIRDSLWYEEKDLEVVNES